MKCLVLKKYRQPLILVNSPAKRLADSEIRVRTSYAGLSFTDRIIQQGLYKYQRQHLPLPYVPGFEASGTITEVGKAISNFNVGDTVAVLKTSSCLSSEIIASPREFNKTSACD